MKIVFSILIAALFLSLIGCGKKEDLSNKRQENCPQQPTQDEAKPSK